MPNVHSTKLETWLYRLIGDLTEEGAVSRFELWHSVEGEQNERLATIELKEGAVGVELLRQVQDTAELDAETRTGAVQRYVIFAFRSDSMDHDSQCAFLVRVSSKNFGDNSEPPTDKGMQTQFMRFSENMHRLTIGATDQLLGRTSQELDRERNRRMALEQANLDMAERNNALLDRESERRIEEAAAIRKAQRIDELLGVATAMLPLLLTKVLGGPSAAELGAHIGGGAAGATGITTPRELALRKLFKNLTEEETLRVFGSLGETNRMAMVEIYQSLREDEAVADAQKPDVLRH